MKNYAPRNASQWLLACALFTLAACSASRSLPNSPTGDTATDAITAAAEGGKAGERINQYMDQQAEEIRQALDETEVERIGEGILITFASGLLFDVGSYQLRDQTQANIIELAKILKKYEDTAILVEGHTDDRGTEEYNVTLSENRARSVFNLLTRQGVAGRRITVIGYGESQPVQTNSTAGGRQANRRVEIAIFADRNLKKAARRGELTVE